MLRRRTDPRKEQKKQRLRMSPRKVESEGDQRWRMKTVPTRKLNLMPPVT